jgi:hypothetical protein
MKKEFKAIAMRCTEEQYKAIEPKLVGININSVNHFNLHPFLTNISGKDTEGINNISNSESFDCVWDNVRYYDKWDEELFLKCCGIETELKVGQWYTDKTFGKFMFRFSGGYGNYATYGFDYDGVFSEGVGVHGHHTYEQATHKQVKEALIEEAKRRGVWEVPMVGLDVMYVIVIASRLSTTHKMMYCGHPTGVSTRRVGGQSQWLRR